MATSTSNSASPESKKTKKAVSKRPAATGRALAAKKAKTAKSVTNLAIATDLAPAVAIALLDKTEQAPGDPPPALDVLVAGAVASKVEGNVRMQLMFDNGAVLPVEMSAEAGAALSKGLLQELPKKAEPKK